MQPTGQHMPAAMQAPAQTVPPPGQTHMPPVHVAPITDLQSVSEQQLPIGMQVPLVSHAT